jgi:transposase
MDPFRVIKWCNEALHEFHKTQPAPPPEWKPNGHPSNRPWRRIRTALITGKENLEEDQRALINGVRRHNYRLYRAWELKEQLRELYRSVDPRRRPALPQAMVHQRPARQDQSVRNTCTPNPQTLRRDHRRCPTRTIQLPPQRSQQQDPGHPAPWLRTPTPESLMTMVYLCLGEIILHLPTQR